MSELVDALARLIAVVVISLMIGVPMMAIGLIGWLLWRWIGGT
jgi:hypothetical protein